jgi:hypothetical protein
VNFDITDEQLIRYSTFVRCCRYFWECNRTEHQLLIDFKMAYDSVTRDVLYNILTEFGIPMELFTLVKLSLNKTYNKVHIDKHLSDAFPIQNGLK